MPQITTYIRVGDLDKWKTLENKSEFIHNALNSGLPHINIEASDKLPGTIVEPIKTPEEAKMVIENIKENTDGTLSVKDPTKPFANFRQPIPKSFSARKKK